VWGSGIGLKHGNPRVAVLAGAAIIAAAIVAASVAANLSGSNLSSEVTSQASNPWLTASGLARAAQFRDFAGIRSDETWLRFVATDPAALANLPEFGIPMTLAEVKELQARARTTSELSDLVRRFGQEHPDVWGGMYVAGSQVVALLVYPSGEEEASLRRLVSPAAPFTIRTVRWSLKELSVLKDRVLTDFWFGSQYHILDLGVNLEKNVVELQVSGDDPATPGTIAAHFGVGDQLVVTTDGSAVSTMPTGGIVGRAVDTDGRPVAGLDVELIGDIPGSGARGDIGVATGGDGTFAFQTVTATGYEIRLLSEVDASGHELLGENRILVGTARVEVRANEIANVTVTVSWP
jgi:hypothetical protein